MRSPISLLISLQFERQARLVLTNWPELLVNGDGVAAGLVSLVAGKAKTRSTEDAVTSISTGDLAGLTGLDKLH